MLKEISKKIAKLESRNNIINTKNLYLKLRESYTFPAPKRKITI